MPAKADIYFGGDRMIKLYFFTWKKFKEKCVNQSDNSDWIYRGQASSDWKLESTLNRILNGKIDRVLAREYHQSLKILLENEKIKQDPHFQKFLLPKENPFLISFLAANQEHIEDFKNLFKVMISLRHLGFPSPLLDWTKDPLVAAFFAFTNTTINPAICRMNVFLPKDVFGLNIYSSDFEFTGEDSRHDRQQSKYTIAIEHYHADTVIRKELKKGPAFYLNSYDFLEESNVEIEKYIITDFVENRLEILKELYDHGLSFEKLYKQTHIFENTLFRDIAIQTFLIGKNTSEKTIITA